MKLSVPPPSESGPSSSAASLPSAQPSGEPHESTARPEAGSSGSGLAWPAWFAFADLAAAVLTLALVFLLASFPARNSDLWLHLAAGQRLLQGAYMPGEADPFSYSAATRVWVQHSLLFDILAYLTYSAHRYGLVLFKAVMIVVAFGLLLRLRRTGFSLWPWVLMLALAALAAAPQFVMRSSAASLLFLSLTMVLLLRSSAVASNSWRWPLWVALVFWLWALCDQWFFLGPLLLLLAMVGEVVQRWLTPRPADGPVTPGANFNSNGEGVDALGPLPPLPVLIRALVLGVVACTLTPFHIRIWELPVELTGAAVQDPRLEQLFLGPLDRVYYSSPSFGRNLNGLAYVALLVAGGALLGFGVGRLRLSHVTMWVGLAALSLKSLYAIPFFALAAVPLLAGQLNQLSSRARLIDWKDRRSRLLLLGSGLGRCLTLLALVAALVCAWPGWLHPSPGHPSGRRQVGWTVEPDPALVQAAEQIQKWRSEGLLPPGSHGFLASLELANYCAWFAPAEKVFINSRYTHHKAELPVLAAVRGALGMHLRGELAGSEELVRQLLPWEVEYFGVHFTVIETRRQPELTALVQQLLWQDREHFALWYLDGRTTLGGWRPQPGQEQPNFTRLRIDPVRLAFATETPRLQPPPIRPVPLRLGWEADFLFASRWPSPSIDEAFAWSQYARLLEERHQQRLLRIQLTLRAVDQILGGGGLLLAATPTWPPDPEQQAVPFLALRAARRAQADAPDDPDTYAALAEALALSRLPLSADERAVARATALRQCLSRLPSPEEFTPGIYYAHPAKIAVQLAGLYLGERQAIGVFSGMPVNLPAFHLLRRIGATGSAVIRGGQVVEHTSTVTLLPLDIARDTLRLAQGYLEQDPQAFGDQTARLAEELNKFFKQVQEETQRLENLYEREKLRLPSQGTATLAAQLALALRHNLVGEALRLLETEELRNASAEIEFARVVLLAAVGRLEEAAALLEGSPQRYESVASLREPVRWLRYQLAVLAGDYAEAGAILEDFAAATVGQDPPPPRRGETLPQLPGIPFITRPDGQPFPYDTLKATVLTVWLHPYLLNQLAFDQLLHAVLAPYEQYRQQLLLRRISDAEYFWRRGYLYLVEGDILRGYECLKQARRRGVPEWDIPDYSQPVAEEYRRLLERVRHP